MLHKHAVNNEVEGGNRLPTPSIHTIKSLPLSLFRSSSSVPSSHSLSSHNSLALDHFFCSPASLRSTAE